jgi:uncharacterized membrane protein YidH (DUF202 family)
MSIIFVSLGVFLCFFGLIGLGLVIYYSFQAREETKADEKKNRKRTFEQLIIVNYLALSLSTFGLMILVLGLLLN